MIFLSDNRQFLDIKQIITKTNLTSGAIYAKMKAGTFPQGQKIGYARVWTVEEIENWFENKEAKS